MVHRDEVLGYIHGPVQWSYANTTAMNAATGFVTADVTQRKCCVVTADNSMWMLTATTPTWVRISASGITGDVAITTAGVSTVTDLTIASEAEGDMLYRNATVWVRKAKGTANQILGMHATNSAPEYKTITAGAGIAVAHGTGAITLTPNHALVVVIPGTVYVADNIIWTRAPYAMTLTKVRFGLATAPTGTGSTKAKVMYHATDPTAPAVTIFTDETNAPAIATGAFTDDSGTPDTTAISEGGWIGVGFSAVCATTPGTNAVIELLET